MAAHNHNRMHGLRGRHGQPPFTDGFNLIVFQITHSKSRTLCVRHCKTVKVLP